MHIFPPLKIQNYVCNTHYINPYNMFDLKKFREANGITQVELAKYLGVEQGFISQMESSDRQIPQKHIDKILNNTNGWDISMMSEPKRIEDRIWFIIQDQSKTIQFLLGMLKEKDRTIRELRSQLESK